MNHANSRKDALHAGRMSVGFGGAQATPHSSFTDPKYAPLILGEEPAQVIVDGRPVDCKLKPGDTQYFAFRVGDPPPWYKPDAPPHDRATGKRDRDSKEVIEEGYIGKPKGMKQVLLERGLWKEGMKKRLEDDDEAGTSLSMHHVLFECWDFATETTALMEKLRARGHILLMCVKCHPELAGVGIENTWGKSALHFRRNNDCVAAHLDANVQNSLHSANLPLRTIRKFACRTREYLRAYMCPDGETSTHAHVEKLRQTFKCHRGSLYFDFHFIRDA